VTIDGLTAAPADGVAVAVATSVIVVVAVIEVTSMISVCVSVICRVTIGGVIV
jgi:hypothetical protein